jgi:hypothetical protein
MDVTSLSTWECDSYLHGPQKLEVHLYPTRFEHEAVKMAQVDQRLRDRISLPPGKANVIADALSHKAHCSYLPAVHLTGEESSTRVLPDL